MGLDHNLYQSIPTSINELNNLQIKSISVGDYHNLCLSGNSFFLISILTNLSIENGNMYCWGSNDYGQLGIGNDED